MSKKTAFLLLPYFVAMPVGATTSDFLDLSLDDLLNVPITVASRKALSQRESPGVVTVIDGDDIRRSGARDLIDVLRQVPGFDFRLIVSNILGLGVRGHIGSDGRVLMLVDGIEANEHRFGTAQFGLNFPVETIQRIEIVRGSALAMYGGTAEMGVINIITRGAAELDGAEVSGALGFVDAGRKSREQFTVSTGVQSGELTLSAHLMRGRSLRSDQNFQGRAGAGYDMAASDGVEPQYANVGLAFGKLQLRYQKEDVDVKSRYANAAIQTDAWSFKHRSESALVQGEWKPWEQVTVSPSLSWQKQSPRETTNAQGVVFSQTRLERRQAKVGLAWNAGPQWHLAGGVDDLQESYDGVTRPFPLRALAYDSLHVTGLYGELLFHSEWGDITWGARKDAHQFAGDLWSHRVALTRQAGDWHFKVLASAAQRAPSVEDYSSGANGLAVRLNEKVSTTEIEAGYRFDARTQLSVNVFDIRTQDTLILTNNKDVRTQGLEAVLQLRRDWGHADVSLSSYASNGTDTAALRVSDPVTGELLDSQALLAFSPWKIAANASVRVGKGAYLSPSVVVYAPRWGYDAPASTATQSRLRQFPTAALANLALQLEDTVAKGVTLTLGVYNLFGAQPVFAAPFATTAPAVPDMGREWVIHARYRF